MFVRVISNFEAVDHNGRTVVDFHRMEVGEAMWKMALVITRMREWGWYVEDQRLELALAERQEEADPALWMHK